MGYFNDISLNAPEDHIVVSTCFIHQVATIRILGGGEFFKNKYLGKIGEINKWPQGKVEIQPILRGENVTCEINRNAQEKLQPPPRYLIWCPLPLGFKAPKWN